MTSMQKKGFRLPWGADRSPDADATQGQLDDAQEPTSDAARDDLGEGPFGLVGATHPKTMDAAPAASDVPEPAAEDAMMDAESHSTPNSEAPPDAAAGTDAGAPPDPASANGGWPAVDRRSGDRRLMGKVPEPRMPRRDNPLVAGLVKAMREAAIASREETTARLQAEATARVEAIRARATTETAALRKRAEDDVAAIREWSKAGDRPRPPGDRRADRGPQDRARRRDRAARGERRPARRRGPDDRLGIRGGHGPVLQATPRRGRPGAARDARRTGTRSAGPPGRWPARGRGSRPRGRRGRRGRGRGDGRARGAVRRQLAGSGPDRGPPHATPPWPVPTPTGPTPRDCWSTAC